MVLHNLARFTLTPQIASLTLLIGLSASHLWLANLAGLGVDEAHYGLYALIPSWSYFDHPPLIGWLLIPFVSLGDSEWLIRLPAILLWLASNLAIYRLSQTLFPKHAWQGFWTLVLVNGAIMMQLLGLAPLPEAPLILFSLLTLLTLLKIRHSNRWQDWLWLGAWLGLAALSKYTAIVLVISLILVMLVERRFYWLSQFKTWSAVLLTLIMISPVLIWNYQHDWISFNYQLEHGTRDPNWQISRFFIGQAAQLIVYGPLLFIGGLFSLVLIQRQWQNHQARLLILFALPIVLLFGYGGGHKLTLPHWTALAWILLAPIVVDWLLRNWQKTSVRILIYLHATWVIGLGLAVKLLIIMPQLASAPNHPLQELHGWPQVIERAQHWQNQHTTDRPDLWVTNWTHASRLAWYNYPNPTYIDDYRFDQFDLWYPLPTSIPKQAIFIIPEYGDRLVNESTLRFERCQHLEKLTYPNSNRPIVHYNIYLCHAKPML